MVRQKRKWHWRDAVLLLILPFLIVLIPAVIFLFIANRVLLYLIVRLLWLPKGKDVLVVYSDSPIWHEYMTTQIIPIIGERAVILNWSERKKWQKWPIAVHLFRTFPGD